MMNLLFSLCPRIIQDEHHALENTGNLSVIAFIVTASVAFTSVPCQTVFKKLRVLDVTVAF